MLKYFVYFVCDFNWMKRLSKYNTIFIFKQVLENNTGKNKEE